MFQHLQGLSLGNLIASALLQHHHIQTKRCQYSRHKHCFYREFWLVFIKLICNSLLETQCNLDCLICLSCLWSEIGQKHRICSTPSSQWYALHWPSRCVPDHARLQFHVRVLQKKEITDVKCHTEEIFKNISILYGDIDDFKNSHNRQSVADQGMNLHRIR